MAPENMLYDSRQASIYASLGIENTTYEIGFRAAAELLGNLRGKTVLDFGCGTGRSSAFLRRLGATSITGIDRNKSMLALARQSGQLETKLICADTIIPTKSATFDVVFSSCVLIEFRTRDQLQAFFTDVSRTLCPGGVFIAITTNPNAFFSHHFKNFSYSAPVGLESGQTAKCTIRSGKYQFDIEDTYWAEADYRKALEAGGLGLELASYPLGSQRVYGSSSEANVAPFVVLKAVSTCTLADAAVA